MLDKTLKDPLVVDSLPMNIIHGQTYSIAQANPNTYTHIFFKYPCRFIPEIPRWAIRRYLGENKGVVFDPFAGSGTTLLEGVISNHESFGTEIDAIAELIIKVKTTPLSPDQFRALNSTFEHLVEKVQGGDIIATIPRINNLGHWFNETNTNYLGKIKTMIDETEDIDIKDFLNLCFVSIIKKVSNADDISPKPYVSSKFKKIPPNALDEFIRTYKRYLEAIQQLSELNISRRAVLTGGDALNIKFDRKIDLAVTSPPYINAFDYGRILRLENLWVGALTEEEIRNKKKDYVGTESFQIACEEDKNDILEESELLLGYYNAIYPIDKKRALVVKKFFRDMKTNLIEINKTLKQDGHYIIVIGNSTIRNVEVESWKVIENIAQNLGFKTDIYFNYIIQNPYIRIPRGTKGGKINKDNVLVLKKGGVGYGTEE